MAAPNSPSSTAAVSDHHNALVLDEVGKPMRLELRPTPKPGPGSVLIRILASSIRANSRRVYQEPTSGHPLPTPFVPGFAAIGRVAETGPDATSLQGGQLVFFDPYMIARDSSDAKYISGLMECVDEESRTLSRGEWRDSTFAEFANLPLENCFPLDEARLMRTPQDGELGYTLDNLTHLFSMLIPFGGLADINLKAGETAIIAPATGRYGSAAVHLALALGARVIAIGRNRTILEQLATIHPQRLSAIPITGDVDADTQALRAVTGPSGADVFWDMSPAGAGTSTHFTSSLNALKNGARISLMGSVLSGVSFNYMQILIKGLTIKGTWMCTKEQTSRLIKMVETGLLQLDAQSMGPVRKFRLEDWAVAFDTGAERTEPGEVVITP
uniref:Alcohol dehydrogenase-like C-terminal domain-containing protein n=1 Tax=Bionectria ochroleuca TaxID=29856 RepID=A0A8H7NPW5_BIOOC